MNGKRTIVITPLDRTKHDRAAFTCGKESLDTYLQQTVRQDAKRRVAVAFVATYENDFEVLGYYTLSQSSVILNDLPRAQQAKLPKYPAVPVTLLGRLAVHSKMQGTGLGTRMIGDACRRALGVASEVASAGVLVDAIDDEAVRFYERFGFEPFQSNPTRLFLPMKTIQDGL